MTPALSLDVEDTAMDAVFAELTLGRRLLHERAEAWPTEATEVPPLGAVVASHRTRMQATHVVEREEGALRIRVGHGWAKVLLACTTLEDADALLAIVRHQVPPARGSDEGRRRVSVTFWSNGTPEPSRADRRLDVPAWGDVAGNYAGATRERLGALMTAQPPLDGGRLVLWHGPPGTGKTNALRALAWEWRDRAALHYVTDPEELLIEPGYLQSVLLAPGDRRWRLIVLEDAGELLAPDAKERAGRGLARLLNLTDGLVGQGLKALVLITGNEPLDRLHPAVARPGRCAAQIAFEPFDAAAATDWLRERGPVAVPPASATLAELYARLEGRPAPPARHPIGFVRQISAPEPDSADGSDEEGMSA